MHSYPVHDLHLPSTYLLLPEKRNKLCLFCGLNLLNVSSLDKVVIRRKCKHKEISHLYPNLFISLAYILASASNEVRLKEESGSAAKKPKFVSNGEPGISGVSSARKTRKFKGKDKGKLHFKFINYAVVGCLKDRSCKISLQT